MSSRTVSVLRLGHFGPWRRAEEGKKACQPEKKILNRMSNTGHTAPKRKVIPHCLKFGGGKRYLFRTFRMFHLAAIQILIK